MKALRGFVGLGAALAFASAAVAADDVHVRVVGTHCAPLQNSRPMPGKDAQAAGETYAALSAKDSAVAVQLAQNIFGPAPSVAELPVVYFYGTTPSGEQWKKEGNWPVQAVRGHTGSCALGAAQSLGRKKGITYALVEVTCPKATDPWTNVRLGMEIADDKLLNFCGNIGEFGSALIPSAVSTRRQERGN